MAFVTTKNCPDKDIWKYYRFLTYCFGTIKNCYPRSTLN